LLAGDLIDFDRRKKGSLTLHSLFKSLTEDENLSKWSQHKSRLGSSFTILTQMKNRVSLRAAIIWKGSKAIKFMQLFHQIPQTCFQLFDAK
jgi:hypothetical protein